MIESKEEALSPQTSRSVGFTNPSGIGSAILSFFKSSKSNNQKDFQEVPNDKSREDEGAAGPFLDIKKRLSSVGKLSAQETPRSNSLNINSQVYSRFYDNIKLVEEEDINLGERRMSTIYRPLVVKNGLVENNGDCKMLDDSPLQGVENSSIQQINASNRVFNDIDNNSDHYMETEEFAPLYEDGDGNLVRPPFINLDPRERYQLLQLKKSMDLSEALERRMKYMINPNETISYLKGNKVETATQTHDLNYLKSSLKFNRKRKVLEKLSQPNKKPKKRGFFGGNFTYDLKSIEEKHKKTSHKLDGYLGSVSEPAFKTQIPTKRKTNIDDPQSLSKFGDLSKSSQNRVGLDESLLKNQKIKTTLDPTYLQRAEKISNIIKVKDVPVIVKELVNQPSAGFKFNINKKDVDNIITTRMENDNLVKSATNSTTKIAFLNKTSDPKIISDTNNVSGNDKGNELSTSNSTGIIFASVKPSSSSNGKTNFNTQLGSIVSKSTDSNSVVDKLNTDAVKRSGTNSETSNSILEKSSSITGKRNLGSINADNTTSSKTFSFAGSIFKADTVADKNSKPEEEGEPMTKKPMFLFSEPGPTKDNEKSSSLFGASSSSTTFLFNPPSADSISTTTQVKPGSLFGSNLAFEVKADTTQAEKVTSKESAAPSGLSLKAPEKSTFGGFTFGQKPTNENKSADENKPKPAFSFGGTQNSKPAESSQSRTGTTPTAPVFSFGDFAAKAAEKTESTKSTPSFSFGKPKESTNNESIKPTPVFSFDKPKDNTNNDPSKTTTGFSFDKAKDTTNNESNKTFLLANKTANHEVGKDINTPSKSAFDFGTKAPSSGGIFGTASASNEAVKSPFNFGNATGSQPVDVGKQTGFTFGSTSKESTPGLSGTPKPFNSNSNVNFKFAPGIQSNKSFTNPTTTSSFVSPNQPSTTGFNFGGGATTGFNTNPIGTNNTNFSIGQQSNNSSRQVTPNFNFGPTMNLGGFNSQPTQAMTQAPTMNQAPKFNFTGINSREPTPDPAQIFGGNNKGFNNSNGISMPQPQFGGGVNLMNSTPTPPLAGVPPGRVIARMRKRRNH
jgi:nucleoporin NUP1